MYSLLEILEREELTNSQKLLLLALKLTDDGEGISYNQLAFYTSMTRKTIITHLHILEDKGYLRVKRNTTYINIYEVLI